jgi:sulfur relay (sulfurtransferase) complex TusBCD TusD component (DsrE family)
MNLAKREANLIRVFLMGDGVQCAIKGQETRQGYYNIKRMFMAVMRGGEVAT